MPLLVGTLVDEIVEVGLPETAQEAAQLWPAAFRRYFSGLTTPPVLPAAHLVGLEAARAGFGSAPIVDDAYPPNTAPAVFAAALAGYAAAIVAGAGAVGFIATAPPQPFVTPALPPILDARAAATTLAAAIDAWARTGLAAPVPGPPASPWA